MPSRIVSAFGILLVFFVLAGFMSNPETGASIAEVPELKISREALRKVVTMKDLIPELPAECKIQSAEFVITTIDGQIKVCDFRKDADLEGCVFAENARSLYINIRASCKAISNKTYKITVT